ncbi:hypothetical protein OHU11_00810 [Streptomyces sp. NBC_00257]|uniref:hypothetical protein n=1 Tax=unclassified Streptomyces TaxID=2593676 RepID=UPI00224F68EC|nr:MULTISPECIES: hypothetical protein [unclassified Streptomyces]MCX5426314.1 hypothetical protein [Streptomyces sp. NBC_00062]
MFEETLDALSQLAEHKAMPFPPGFRGLDIDDQDMVMLDADVYGYALGVLEGPLDEQRGKGVIRLTAVFEKLSRRSTTSMRPGTTRTYATWLRWLPKSRLYARSSPPTGKIRPARGRGGWMCGDVRPMGARRPSLPVCAD